MSNQAIVIQRLAQVRQQLLDACHAAARPADAVTLLAVSKQHPSHTIRLLASAGQHDFGESYVQEAFDKMAELADLSLCWHFIGQLQSNKTRAIAEHFDWVHTLDRDKIATRLHEQRPAIKAPLQVCIQVKLAEEAGKGGVWPDQVAALAGHVRHLSRLRLRGLMCIPPPSDDYHRQLQRFQQLTELQAQLNAADRDAGIPAEMALDTLSMGMSGDCVAAIAAGSTMVRIGTAIFGERYYEQRSERGAAP